MFWPKQIASRDGCCPEESMAVLVLSTLASENSLPEAQVELPAMWELRHTMLCHGGCFASVAPKNPNAKSCLVRNRKIETYKTMTARHDRILLRGDIERALCSS